MGLFDRFRRPASGDPAAVRARLRGRHVQTPVAGLGSANPPLENINTLVASGGPKLLARARELVFTNGYPPCKPPDATDDVTLVGRPFVQTIETGVGNHPNFRRITVGDIVRPCFQT